ncbi:hypothetical protein AB0I94_00090 [Streptomyces sp. NPDC050147]
MTDRAADGCVIRLTDTGGPASWRRATVKLNVRSPARGYVISPR